MLRLYPTIPCKQFVRNLSTTNIHCKKVTVFKTINYIMIVGQFVFDRSLEAIVHLRTYTICF